MFQDRAFFGPMLELSGSLVPSRHAHRRPGDGVKLRGCSGPYSFDMTSVLLAAILAAQAQAPAAYEVLSDPSDARPYLSRLGEKTQDVWLDGEVLHIACRAGEGPIELMGGIQMPLKRIGSSDLWLARLKRLDWSRAFVSYAFMGPKPGAPRFEVWRGTSAPTEPKRETKLSRVEHLEVKSKVLGENRKVTVYLPPVQKERAGVIVLADGQGTEAFAQVLQALIPEGKIRPMVIVGIHSGRYQGDPTKPYDPKQDLRAREYLEAADPARFDAHLKWVTEELLPEVRTKFDLSSRREDTGVAGFSNGGAFAASAAIRRPDVFGVGMPMSVGVPPKADPPPGPAARFFFAAGELEPRFLKGTTAAHERAKALGADSRLNAFVAGHDPMMWQVAFAQSLPDAFPPRETGTQR